MKLPPLSFLYGGLQSILDASTTTPNNWSDAGKAMKNFVVFGDSYSDVSYVWDGGLPWPNYVVQYTGMKLHPYAASGGTCSNRIVERPYPSIFESQIPQYLADKDSGKIDLSPNETVYTIWIGTNDIGVGGLLNTRGVVESPDGATIIHTSSCVVDWVIDMYSSGARNFLIQNIIPLHHTVLYSADTYPNFFWTGEHNASDWNLHIHQLAQAGNAITSLMLKALAPKLSGAHIALFDSYTLFTDILEHPTLYLNGTAPVELRKPVKSCVYQPNADTARDQPVCKLVSRDEADSHLWYDELHPSEQVNRIVARELARSLTGQDSRWTTWLS